MLDALFPVPESINNLVSRNTHFLNIEIIDLQ